MLARLNLRDASYGEWRRYLQRQQIRREFEGLVVELKIADGQGEIAKRTRLLVHWRELETEARSLEEGNMETQYKPGLDITVARLTYRRVSDILDQLRKADPAATRKALAALDPVSRKIVKARANLSQHPRRSDIARVLDLSETKVLSLERGALVDIFETFQAESKVELRWRW